MSNPLTIHKQAVGSATFGELEVTSGQSVQQWLGLSEEELKQYGNPPPSLHARVTDGSGNVYEGTLYLEKKASDA